MATRNFVPRATGEGKLGTQAKKWKELNVETVNTNSIVTAAISVENSVKKAGVEFNSNAPYIYVKNKDNSYTSKIEIPDGSFTLPTQDDLAKINDTVGTVKSGLATFTTEYERHQLKRKTAYQVGDVVTHPNLPAWARLECIQSGTTGENVPSQLASVQSGGGIRN